MKKHLANAALGILDYASYPFGMLLVAPIVLHRLGAAEYGLWMIATAVISAGGIIASGFSDANIQLVAHLRGIGDNSSIARTVRSILGVNLILGVTLAAAVWFAAPFAARHIATSPLTPAGDCLISLRIAGVLIAARAIETVAVSTQRAFEHYRGTVQIATAVRLLTLASAAILAWRGRGTVAILSATGFFLVLGTCMQFLELRRFVGPISLWPAFRSDETRALLRTGIFVWLEALGGLIFGQFDRILLGVSLGALAVAPYALCVQFAQPMVSLTASALNFFFPYLSSRASTISNAALKRVLLKAFICNFALVACCAVPLLLFGNSVIRLWAGPAVAAKAATILPAIVAGAAMAGLSVTGTYSLQALALFRSAAGISLGAKASMLVVMIFLLHRMGLQGLAIARVFYGSAALLVYLPLFRHLSAGKRTARSLTPIAIPCELREGSES
ncbi:MAG: polysaccharide biosynthesis protein [Terracidiphilus sp.]